MLHVPVGTTYEISEAEDTRYAASFQGSGNQTGNTASSTIGRGDSVNIVCTNEFLPPSLELPKTGGIGTDRIVFAGCTLMALSGLALIRKRQKR